MVPCQPSFVWPNHDALFDTSVLLLSHFMVPQVVNQYKENLLSEEAIKAAVEDPNNYLTTDKIFVGFIARIKANKLLNERDHQSFLNACLCFHKTCFLYALDNFPLVIPKHSVSIGATFEALY